MARTVRNLPVPRKAPEMSQTKNTLFIAGLYIRLSKEDGGKMNRNTIENQKALLEEYVQSHSDMQIYRIYIDNGFSGTNFQRPSFQEMMEDARCGKINCIVVKDLSRFGRNYLETGNYLEKIFPFLKLRFVSVTDHIDSFKKAGNYGITDANGIEVPLKNIVNEVYAKDISRKVGSAIEVKKREGRYGGGVAPYGYRKSEKEAGGYEVDEEAAETVRYIFELRAEGRGYCSIVKILNEKGIKAPGAYRFEKGIVQNERMKNVIWKRYAIEDMQRDEVYLGNMVRGKTHSAIYRGEKRHRVSREEWIVVTGTHAPIVSRELFDRVQTVNKQRARMHAENLQKALQNPDRCNIWKGKIFCGDCGIAMGCTSAAAGSFRYYCPNHKENGAFGCTKKYITSKKLEKSAGETIRIHMRLFLESRDIVREWGKSTETEKRLKVLKHELEIARDEENGYRQKLSEIYFDHKEKLLTIQEYFQLKEKYQAALAECEAACKEKERQYNEMQRLEIQEGSKTYAALSDMADRYMNDMNISKDIVDYLIERVEVFAEGRIQITFRYGDEFEDVLHKRREIERCYDEV